MQIFRLAGICHQTLNNRTFQQNHHNKIFNWNKEINHNITNHIILIKYIVHR
jgi:hypothetical protein